MADKSKLKFYLTGSEPLVSQSDLSQSIGGYPTNSEMNPSAILNTDISRTSDSFTFTGSLGDSSFIQIGDEVMTVNEKESSSYEVTRGSLLTSTKSHKDADLIYEVQRNNLFNNSFSISNKQYRCIAVRNTGTTPFLDLKFYLKYNSSNTNSEIKIALEIPETEILTGTSTSGSTISLVDFSLRNVFDDEYDGSVLVVTNNENINLGRKIASFDKITGTFTFLNAFPFPISSGTTYRIENAPSQRVVSGITSPTTGTIYTTSFSSAESLDSAISIDFSSTRLNGVDLIANEVIYLWIERSILENKTKFDNNKVVLAASYKVI